MTSEELKEARINLTKAKKLIRQGRLQEAKYLLEQVSDLEADLSLKEIVESAAKILSSIERERRLKLTRWVLTGTVLVTSIVVAILTLLPLRSTPIEFKLHVGRAGFKTGTLINIEPLRLAGIDLVGMTELNLKLADDNQITPSDGPIDMPKPLQRPDAHGSPIVRATDPFSRIVLKSSYLRLSDLTAPAKTMVVLETPETSEETLKIILAEKQITGTLDTFTDVTISCQDCEYKDGDKPWHRGDQTPRGFTSENKVVHFASQSDAGNVELNLRLATSEIQGEPLLVGRYLKIESLDLIRPRPPKPPVSSIVQPGEVNFVEFSERQFTVTTGDFLILKQFSDFQIKSVTFGRHFTIEAAGRIGKIVKISGNIRHNLMPSYLEWLLANNALKLFMAALLPVLSVVLAAIYRLKILDEG